MNFFIGLMSLGIVVLIAAFFFWPDPDEKRKNYLSDLAHLLEGQKEAIGGAGHSSRIRFHYQGEDFIFEHIEEEGFQGKAYHQGYLKVNTKTDLVVSFSEKERAKLLASAKAKNAGTTWLPPKLKTLQLYTNHQVWADRLMADQEVVDTLAQFKNVDGRGHPFMAMEILDGVLVLRFYAKEGFKPSLFNLQTNVSRIEEFLDLMVRLVRKIRAIGIQKGFIE